MILRRTRRAGRPARLPRSPLLVPLAAVLVAVASATALAASADDPGIEGAISALKAEIAVEREILDRDRQRYRRATGARNNAATRLSTLIAEQDTLALQAGESAVELIERKALEVAAARSSHARELERLREALGLVRMRLERIDLLEQRLAMLGAGEEAGERTLTGTWDVTYLPSGETGRFALRQSGTLVGGRYSLADGARGSLEGTFVDGDVHLEIIDSKRGRASELDGELSQSGDRLSGTWLNRDLTDGSTAAGSWIATRSTE